MRVLFLHQSFPGPFRRLATHFGGLPGTRVLFLSERGRRSVALPGVRHITVPGSKLRDEGDCKGSGEKETEHEHAVSSALAGEREVAQALRQAAATANSLLRLKKEGFVPDIIYSGTGGEAFYVRDVFPDSFQVVHADWFHTKGSAYTFLTRGKPRPPADFALGRVRNLFQYNALEECQLAVTSSVWQKSQYPEMLGRNLHVVPEGVDASFFAPPESPQAHLSRGEVITFSGRCSGSLRGLATFHEALARLSAKRPSCRALIVGARLDDARRETLRAGLPGGLIAPDAARLRTVSPSTPEQYLNVLHASTVHVYLTAPSTLSSGLFEAMSSGGLVVGSDTEPVREVVRHGENGFLCDFWDATALAETLDGLLERSLRMQSVRDAARQTVLDRYDAPRLVEQHVALVLDRYEAWRSSR